MLIKTSILLFAFFMFSVGLLVALPANAQQYQSIIIYSDGSITGTNNIQHDGNTYTLTDNIFGHIQVQKSYITINGAGYTIKGNNYDAAFDLTNGYGGDPSRSLLNNLTVTNLRILNFSAGIYSNSKNNVFSQLYLANCDSGILLMGAENNLITSNTFENNSNAVSIDYCRGETANVITKNNLINNDIIVWLSTKPIIDRNYYSNYSAKYPNAKEINATGVWDTPYESVRFVDVHPLMHKIEENPIPELNLWGLIPLMLLVSLFAVYAKPGKT
ncbi:MAG: NosD domain-containing protein [Candidatus Bathyarchaeia archaeon]